MSLGRIWFFKTEEELQFWLTVGFFCNAASSHFYLKVAEDSPCEYVWLRFRAVAAKIADGDGELLFGNHYTGNWTVTLVVVLC